jgi:hypothetical protein
LCGIIPAKEGFQLKTIRNESDLIEAKEILLLMEQDPNYITEPAYRANAEVWPDHQISFIECHLHYLKAHPEVSAKHYISNLRLKLKKIVRS